MIHLIALAQFVMRNPLALLACVVASFAVGFVWHGLIFGKMWAKLAGLGNMSKKEAKKTMLPGMTMSIMTAFIQALVLGRGLQIVYMGSPIHAIIVATLLWIPFTGMVLATNYTWGRKPFKLFLIDAGGTLASLWTIAAIMYFFIH